jgi:hypothetical protein
MSYAAFPLQHLNVLLNAESLSAAVLGPAVRRLAGLMQAEWTRLAQQNLGRTRDEYIKALVAYAPEVDGLTARVFLAGEPKLAGLIEGGAAAWDLRDTVFQGRTKVHRSAAGHKYAYIPFRHFTPGTTGTHGRKMGAEDASGEMGKAIYQQAKRLAPYVAGQKTDGKRVMRLPAGVGGATLLKPHHTTDVYAGMIRNVQAIKGGRQQSVYTTFRTISTNPDSKRAPESWQHPGFEARHFAEKVAQYAADVFPSLLGSALGK